MSNSIATLTVTAPSPTATGKQIRALSAANWARDTNSREIQVYTLYTDGSLIIRGFSQGVWSSSVPLPLSPVPRADSSIAAIATLAGPRLYYVSDSGSIAEAASESSNNCPGDIKACSWSFRTLTDTQVSGGGIAAVTGDFSNSLSGTHVYYFAPGGNLTEIVNFNGWGKPKVIFNNLRTANDVTVSAVAGQNGSEVFYFDGSLHWTHSSDGWSSGK